MKIKTLSNQDYQLFLFKSLFCLGLAWGCFALSLTGFFYTSIIWALFALVIIWFAKKAYQNNFFCKPSGEFLIASIICLFIVLTFSLFSTPTVFSGRDQGSFSQAAINLAHNHQLTFSTPASQEFFKLHESGRALNFPGFYYNNQGQLITQFSLVYISWLAFFFATFGIAGFAIANAVLLYFFFLAFYLLIRLFLNTASALPTALLTSTSFVFMWFAKYTLSENMALPLAWLTILALMLFLKQPRKLTWLVFFFSATLLCFARIEGIALLMVSVVTLFYNKTTRTYFKENKLWRILLPLIFFLAFFLLNAFADRYFYKEILKALLPQSLVPKAKLLNTTNGFEKISEFYSLKIFFLYGLFGFFAVGAISVIITFCKKEFYKLIPFFIISPTLIYFLDANISSDHPWMLRRYMFTLLPIAIFYSGLLIGQLLENKSSKPRFQALAVLLATVLFGLNLPAFSKYLTFSENKNLLNQTQDLSAKFSAHDLILVDRDVTGDGWNMLDQPMSSLFGKNAVYFFNTSDLAKLNTDKFENIYLIAPNKQTDYYLNSTLGPKLYQTDTYDLTFSKLNIHSDEVQHSMALPEKQTFTVQGKIFKITK